MTVDLLNKINYFIYQKKENSTNFAEDIMQNKLLVSIWVPFFKQNIPLSIYSYSKSVAPSMFHKNICIISPSRCSFSPTSLNYSKSKHIHKEYGIQNESNKLLIFPLQENLSHIAARLASTHLTRALFCSVLH